MGVTNSVPKDQLWLSWLELVMMLQPFMGFQKNSFLSYLRSERGDRRGGF